MTNPSGRIERFAAQGLAVAYGVFTDRFNKGDVEGLGIWSAILRRRQDETGITLVDPVALDELDRKGLNAYKRRRDEENAARHHSA